MFDQSRHRPVAVFCRLSCVVLASAWACAAPAIAADVEKGRATYRTACASCHAVTDDANIFGPHLKGVYGRPAASVADYAYSDAMKAAGEGGLVWDEAALSTFLSKPSKLVPGTKMRFFGFWFQSEIDDVIAYLKANP
ncbi:c-type cytochrome [Rhizobium sp. SL86]|uniref:c-type cytochrome n=1 Tax=Rhizobium sp. SL86 TaxID=2995148 RepID=UPI002272DCD9|nr:cytochrome c family protein [Rhizobium sp. SL86]MCY1668445.1 cytochrome c family protein [Rhizobium sp. SL86]